MSLRALILVVMTMLLASTLAMAQTYTVTDLGALSGFTSSYADDNNNTGLSTGCSDNSVLPTIPCTTNIPTEAFLWSTSTHTMQGLGNLPGNNQSIGYEVADSGVVVGSSGNTTTGVTQGFIWQSGVMTALPPLSVAGGYTIADAITSTGVIVGESAIANGDVHGVIWAKSGGNYVAYDIGILPNAPYTYPYDINEKYQVTGIGYFNEAGTSYHAFLWSQKKGWQDLGTLPGGTNSEGIWMTDSGYVAGMSTSAKYPNGVTVIWDLNEKIHSLGTLPGGTSSAPGFISDDGQVLGSSTVSGGANHAYIWTETTGMQDLNNLIPPNSGWVLQHASSIDKNGNIVGYGSINGEDHGFLLTPVN